MVQISFVHKRWLRPLLHNFEFFALKITYLTRSSGDGFSIRTATIFICMTKTTSIAWTLSRCEIVWTTAMLSRHASTTWKWKVERKLKLNELTTLFEKFNFCPKIQFWQNHNIFTSFSPKFFLTIFLVKSKLSTAKKSKTTTFSRVFHPKKIDNFLGKSKWNFWTKNEDFEHYVEGEFFNYIISKLPPCPFSCRNSPNPSRQRG